MFAGAGGVEDLWRKSRVWLKSLGADNIGLSFEPIQLAADSQVLFRAVGDDLVKVFASGGQNSIWRYLHKFQDLYAMYEIDGRYPSGLFTALSMADSSVVGLYQEFLSLAVSVFKGENSDRPYLS